MSATHILQRYFRVQRRDIAYFRFILEAYEGLATLCTLDARDGIVALVIPECFAEEVDDLLAALGCEIGLTEIPLPDHLSVPFTQETCHNA